MRLSCSGISSHARKTESTQSRRTGSIRLKPILQRAPVPFSPVLCAEDGARRCRRGEEHILDKLDLRRQETAVISYPAQPFPSISASPPRPKRASGSEARSGRQVLPDFCKILLLTNSLWLFSFIFVSSAVFDNYTLQKEESAGSPLTAMFCNALIKNYLTLPAVQSPCPPDQIAALPRRTDSCRAP